MFGRGGQSQDDARIFAAMTKGLLIDGLEKQKSSLKKSVSARKNSAKSAARLRWRCSARKSADNLRRKVLQLIRSRKRVNLPKMTILFTGKPNGKDSTSQINRNSLST
jgi:hypothetical protein